MAVYVSDGLTKAQHGGTVTRTIVQAAVAPYSSGSGSGSGGGSSSTRPTTGQLWPRGDGVP